MPPIAWRKNKLHSKQNVMSFTVAIWSHKCKKLAFDVCSWPPFLPVIHMKVKQNVNKKMMSCYHMVFQLAIIEYYMNVYNNIPLFHKICLYVSFSFPCVSLQGSKLYVFKHDPGIRLYLNGIYRSFLFQSTIKNIYF